MAAFDILVWSANNREKRTPSASNTFDFLSVKIGADGLEIKETSNNFDFSGVKLTNLANGSAATDATTYGQSILRSGANAFTANQPMGGNKLTGLAAGSGAGDSVRYEQAILINGANAFTADQSMGNNKLTNLADPVGQQDAATKAYVDAVSTGLDPKAAVRVATTAALPSNTYANGTSGVGATLTAAANGALPSIDGVSLSLGDRLLVKNEASALKNGIYTVTALGDGSNPYVLTRATDADTCQPASNPEVTSGLYTLVTAGTANKGYGYVLTTNDPITLGTTGLTFDQFSSPAVALVAGDAISITGGTTIAVDFTKSYTNDNGSSITQGQIVYLKSNGNVDLATWTNASDAVELGVVYDASISASASGKVTVRRGAIVGGFSSLTVGAPVYVGSTGGAVTQSLASISAGQYVHRVGYAYSATQVIFDPSFVVEY
jgi:hypothetical protein